MLQEDHISHPSDQKVKGITTTACLKVSSPFRVTETESEEGKLKWPLGQGSWVDMREHLPLYLDCFMFVCIMYSKK